MLEGTFHVVSTLYWLNGEITQVVVDHDVQVGRIDYPISKTEALKISAELSKEAYENPRFGVGQCLSPTYSVMVDTESQIR